MSKAAPHSTRSPDAVFHEMVRRYDGLYAEWDRFYDAAAPNDPDDNDPRYQERPTRLASGSR